MPGVSKTALSPLLWQWRYCSLAQSHQYEMAKQLMPWVGCESYQWLGTRLQYLHCQCSGDTAVLCSSYMERTPKKGFQNCEKFKCDVVKFCQRIWWYHGMNEGHHRKIIWWYHGVNEGHHRKIIPICKSGNTLCNIYLRSEIFPLINNWKYWTNS